MWGWCFRDAASYQLQESGLLFGGGAVEGSLSSKFPGGGGFSIFLRGNFPGREEEKLEKRKSI